MATPAAQRIAAQRRREAQERQRLAALAKKRKAKPSTSKQSEPKKRQNTRSQAKKKADASYKTKRQQLKSQPTQKLGTKLADNVQGALGSTAKFIGDRLPQSVKGLGKKYMEGLEREALRDYKNNERLKKEGGLGAYFAESKEIAQQKQDKFRKDLSDATRIDQRITDTAFDVAVDSAQGRLGASALKGAGKKALKVAGKKPAPLTVKGPRTKGTVKAPKGYQSPFSRGPGAKPLEDGKFRSVGAAGRPTSRDTAAYKYDVVTGPRLESAMPASQDRIKAPKMKGKGIIRKPKQKKATGPRTRTPDEIRANIRANEKMRGKIRRGDATGQEASAYNKRDKTGEVVRRGPAVKNIGRDQSPRQADRVRSILNTNPTVATPVPSPQLYAAFGDKRGIAKGKRPSGTIKSKRNPLRIKEQLKRADRAAFESRKATAFPAIQMGQYKIKSRNQLAGKEKRQAEALNKLRGKSTAQQSVAASANRAKVTAAKREGVKKAAPPRYNINPVNKKTADRPKVTAKRSGTSRIKGGKGFRQKQQAQAKAYTKEMSRRARNKADISATRKGIAKQRRDAGKVIKSTPLKRRGVDPKTGKATRLFTPENRAAALKRKGSQLQDGGRDTSIPRKQELSKGDKYTSAGGKITIGQRKGAGTVDMSFKSINSKKGYASDKELKADGFKVRTKSGVDQKLNTANVSNQQGAIMKNTKVGDTITAQPIDKRRALLYKRATNGALDFKEIGGQFYVKAEKIGPTTFRNVNGKVVEFDPSKLSQKIDAMASKKTPRRLVGRRLKDKQTGGRAGGSKAKLKISRNKRKR